MKLFYFSAYPHDDQYKQRLHHMLPYLKETFSELVVASGIMPFKDRLKTLFLNPIYWFRPKVETIDGVKYVTIFPLLPNRLAFRWPALFKFNHWIVNHQVKKWMQEFDIVGTCHPFMYTDVIRKAAAKIKFYDCPDVYEDFPYAIPKVSLALEKKIIDAVDICFGSSQFICELKTKQFGKKFIPVLNAVDYEFHQAKIAGREWPRNSDRKKIVYVGSLAEWFDYDVLEDLIRTFREHDFILVGGPSPTTRARLQELVAKYSNLDFRGLQNYSAIPEIIASADVGIIPFRKSVLIDGVSPLKFFEYAAHGLPVVSTRWREILNFEPVMYLCDTKSDFAKALTEALAEGRSDEIIEIAKQNSWRARVRQIESEITAQMGR